MRKQNKVRIFVARVFSHARVKTFYTYSAYSFYNSVGDSKTSKPGGKWWAFNNEKRHSILVSVTLLNAYSNIIVTQCYTVWISQLANNSSIDSFHWRPTTCGGQQVTIHLRADRGQMMPPGFFKTKLSMACNTIDVSQNKGTCLDVPGS